MRKQSREITFLCTLSTVAGVCQNPPRGTFNICGPAAFSLKSYSAWKKGRNDRLQMKDYKLKDNYTLKWKLTIHCHADQVETYLEHHSKTQLPIYLGGWVDNDYIWVFGWTYTLSRINTLLYLLYPFSHLSLKNNKSKMCCDALRHDTMRLTWKQLS